MPDKIRLLHANYIGMLHKETAEVHYFGAMVKVSGAIRDNTNFRLGLSPL